MYLSRQTINTFQKKIFSWWENNRRDLPWRHTHDPYKIMVSEIMLQQTQVSRVLPKYTEFIAVFPTVASLAQAKTSRVLQLWKGMGYNRRALYLHKAAQKISLDFNNHFPMSEHQLSKLPGIGAYTSRAILVFAYKKDVAMVDTNIRKIITHFFFNDEKQPEKVIEGVASKLVPKGKSWEWHQALMDYGAAHSTLFPSQYSHPSHVSHISHTTPFRESNRFYRGRILDLVRERTWKEKELGETMVKKYGKDLQFYENLLSKLLQEGLLVRSLFGLIFLPE